MPESSAPNILDEAKAPKTGGEGVFTAPHKGHGKWLWVLAIAGGAAAAGMAFGRSQGGVPAASPAAVGISIGSPSITVGHP